MDEKLNSSLFSFQLISGLIYVINGFLKSELPNFEKCSLVLFLLTTFFCNFVIIMGQSKKTFI